MREIFLMKTILPIYDEETFYSWFSRMYYYNDGSSNTDYLERNFGRKSRLSMHIPSCLDFFLENIGDTRILKLNSCESILNEMTSYPFYSAFWSENMCNEFKSTVKENISSLICQTALCRRHDFYLATKPIIKLCPECMIEDYFNHGIVYIHREHSVINHYFCYKHKIELKYIYKKDYINKSGLIKLNFNDIDNLKELEHPISKCYSKEENSRCAELVHLTFSGLFNSYTLNEIKYLIYINKGSRFKFNSGIHEYNPFETLRIIANAYDDLGDFYILLKNYFECRGEKL